MILQPKIGAAYEMNFDDFNSLTSTLEIDKLLIPSPRKDGDPEFDKDGNKIADYREKGLFEGIFGSFNDAPGGFSEEPAYHGDRLCDAAGGGGTGKRGGPLAHGAAGDAVVLRIPADHEGGGAGIARSDFAAKTTRME